MTCAVSSVVTLAALLVLRILLGWHSDLSAVWLAVGLITAYGCFFVASLSRGISDDDRAVLDALMTKVGLASPEKLRT